MGTLIGVGILVGTAVLTDPPRDWTRDEGVGSGGSDDADVAGDGTITDAGADAEAEVEVDGGTGKDPDADVAPGTNQNQYTWREMVRTWQFWVMYFMFFAVSAAGLMITARAILYAEESGLTAGMATLAATLLPIGSAGGRLVVGGLSDRFDRERITAVSFLVCGLATIAVVAFAGLGDGSGYVVDERVAVFFWSSQFSLFPSLVGDYYGSAHSSTNYSLVYSGKMWGGVFGGGVVGWLIGIVGWDATFLLGGGLAMAAGLAGLLLRPP
jgi:OFA family oxalate/formate antiporter-like MFS transporter